MTRLSCQRRDCHKLADGKLPPFALASSVNCSSFMCFYFSVFTELFSSYQSIFVRCWPLILVLLSFCSLSFQTCCSCRWLRALSSVVLCLCKDLLCFSYCVQNKQLCSDALLTFIEPFWELLCILNTYSHVSNFQLQTCQNKENDN